MRRFLFVYAILGVFAWWLNGFYRSGGAFVNECQQLLTVFVIIAVIIALIIDAIVMIKNSSPVGTLIALIVGLGIIGIGSSFLTSSLGGVSALRNTFCVDCTTPREVKALREKGSLAAAEEQIRKFLSDESSRNQNAVKGPDFILPTGCIADGEVELAQVLRAQASKILDDVESLNIDKDTADASVYTQCSDKIDLARKKLDEALILAKRYEDDNPAAATLVEVIQQSQKNLDLIAKQCAPPEKDSTYNFSPSNKQIDKEGIASFELQLSVDGKFKSGDASLLKILTKSNVPIPAQVTEVKASEQMCMMLVVDNSQSLNYKPHTDGVKNVQNAIVELNNARKQGDYFGMVVFGSNTVSLTTPLNVHNLDETKVNGTGGITAIWQAMNVGLDELANCQVEKRNLILVTDGLDTSGYVNTVVAPDASKGDDLKTALTKKYNKIVSDIRTKASENAVDIYVVTVGDGGTIVDQTNAFKQITDTYGYKDVSFDGLAAQFRQLFGSKDDHYLITFKNEAMGDTQIVKVRHDTANAEVDVDFSKP
jgi:von Willebrand factor type A domain